MHGLINKSIQCFVQDTYGVEAWKSVVARARLGIDGFEAMLTYDDAVTDAVLTAAAQHLGKPRDMILEDLGTYLVSSPNVKPLRRLLRFGGETFLEFLYSLDDLHDRARLAVPDLALPQLELADLGEGAFELAVQHDRTIFGPVIVGILRAMADDYGALAFLDPQGRKDGADIVAIQLFDSHHARARSFELGQRA